MKFKPFGPYTAAKGASIFFALLLWFNVATEETYNYKVDLPILYLDPASTHMLVNNPPETVQVYLSGTGKNLFYFCMRQLFSPEDSYASVSLAGYPKGSHRVTIGTDRVYTPLGDLIAVESILSNASFTIEIDTKTTKNIAVSVDSLPNYRLDNGLVLNGDPVAVPDFIIVNGPTDMLNQTSSIRISQLQPSVITINDTVVVGLLVKPSSLLTFNDDKVLLEFPVERLRAKLFTSVPVSLRGFPRNLPGALKPDTLSVLIQGPESIISNARAEDITVLVEYRTYLEQTANGDSLVTPTVRYPNGITSASTTPVALRVTPAL